MQDMTVDDFMTGLLAQLALTHIRVVAIDGDRFDSAVEVTFRRLSEMAPKFDLNVRFWVSRHPFHGDSPVVREALSGAVQRDLVSLDNPEYQHMRLKISDDEAHQLLKGLPGGPTLFEPLTEVLTGALQEQTAAPAMPSA